MIKKTCTFHQRIDQMTGKCLKRESPFPLLDFGTSWRHDALQLHFVYFSSLSLFFLFFFFFVRFSCYLMSLFSLWPRHRQHLPVGSSPVSICSLIFSPVRNQLLWLFDWTWSRKLSTITNNWRRKDWRCSSTIWNSANWYRPKSSSSSSSQVNINNFQLIHLENSHLAVREKLEEKFQFEKKRKLRLDRLNEKWGRPTCRATPVWHFFASVI